MHQVRCYPIALPVPAATRTGAGGPGVWRVSSPGFPFRSELIGRVHYTETSFLQFAAMGPSRARFASAGASLDGSVPAGAVDAILQTVAQAYAALRGGDEESRLLQEICRALVESDAYHAAWVGYVERDNVESIRLLAHAGIDKNRLPSSVSTTANEGVSAGPTAATLRTGEPCIWRRLHEEASADVSVGSEAALLQDYEAAAAFPLVFEDLSFGNLTIYANRADAFGQAEMALLCGLASDVARAVGIIRAGPAAERKVDEVHPVYRALRTLSAGNRTLLRGLAERQLLEDMCRVIVDVGGYRMAWVGYAEYDEEKTVRPVAYTGVEMDFFEEVGQISWSDSPRGQGPVGIAIRTGQPSVRRDFRANPPIAAWRTVVLKRGYFAISAFPLRIEDEIIGAIGIGATELDAFEGDELAVLGELAEDLAFGIATLRMRAKHREAEELVRRMAYFDILTGLPNRLQLREQMATVIAVAKQKNRSVALLVVNVDRFRHFNEVFGFEQGDELIRIAADRLKGALENGELLAHLGIDQFAILLPRGNAEYASERAKRILAALESPVDISGIRFTVQASAGISLFPGHGSDPDLLILRADSAMYQAKRGRNRLAVFSGDTEQQNLSRLGLIGALHRAIDEEELVLYCQPKVDLRTGSIRSAEALVRWRHPELGMLEADQFVPLAESTGLVHSLTYWVLDAAIRQVHTWRELGFSLPLAVNLSAASLRDPRLVDRISGTLTTCGADASWLQLELTESALIEDPAAACAVLTRLRNMGISLSVDDYGTGYSSLSYLHQLPIDAIKIDKSFVLGMRNENALQLIVRSSIELAHNLGLEVVAEGVENEDLWNLLRAFGCDLAQGYFVSRAISAEDFLDWQRNSRWQLEETAS